MKTRQCNLTEISLVWAISSVIVFALGATASEPTYKGKSLTYWLRQCYDASLEETQKLSQAQTAINAMGAKQVLPILMKMVRTQDTEGTNDLPQLGIAGFEALDTNGAPAVPELTPMLTDTNGGPTSKAFVALRCLVAIGKPAEAPICSALTNQSPDIRAFAASQIGFVSDDIALYLKRLEGPLADADATVRFAAVQGLGLQTEYPEDVLPYLLRAVNDQSDSVAGYAIKFIGNLGTNGIQAVPALQRVTQATNSYRGTLALRSLISVAPEQAVPTVLAWVSSTNSERRSRGISVLSAFPAQIPQVLESLKKATADPDPKVSRNATHALEDLRKKEKESGAYKVTIPDEPSHKGKTLGEWLKRKPGQEDFSPEAKRAVQTIGTNALPALLARLTYTDSKYGLYDYDTGMEAVGGFVLLGEKALPALLKLAPLINANDQRIALFALISCCNMGSNAIPVVATGFTNKFSDVRGESLHYLTDGPLASFPEARKVATRRAIDMLTDSDLSNRETATNTLWEIDRRAAEELGLKRPQGRFK